MPVFADSSDRRSGHRPGDPRKCGDGRVTNKIHNQTLQAYCAKYPNALLCAPAGLRERQPHLSVAVVLSSGMDFPTDAGGWGQELEVLVTAGNCFFEEAILYHRQSGTVPSR